MDPGNSTGDEMAAVHFRAKDLARRTVEYHRVGEAEHRSRERYGRRFCPFPWSEAVGAVLADEALEDEGSVVALIKELGRQGCSEVALAALELVVTRGSPAPTKAMFDAALVVCATEFQDQRCLEQFARMRSLGLNPDLGSANLVLTGLCCRGRLAEAMALMREMRGSLGLRPNSYSVLMVLQACNSKRRGAYREAIEAVQALEAGGRPANEEVIEALLQVCEAALRAAPTFEAALDVFAHLQQLHLADCTRVYNGLLGAAGRAGRWREAQALYGRMLADDVPTSLETHTALIQACVVGRALDQALALFEQLVAGRSAFDAVPASIATYNHLIHACHQAGMLEKALEIASWVQRTGVDFDDETYGELMATIDVAQLWDDKAMKQARQQHKPVLPEHLRPAPYDAMRIMYLDHLDVLQQEELLALEKLGTLGGWASKSLTRGSSPGGSVGGALTGSSPAPGAAARASLASIATTSAASSCTTSARSLARSLAVTVPVGPFDAELAHSNGHGSVSAWRNSVGVLSPATALHPTGPAGNFAVGGQGPWFASGPAAAPPAAAAERSALPPRATSPPSQPHSAHHSRHTSTKQLMKSQSTITTPTGPSVPRPMSTGGRALSTVLSGGSSNGGGGGGFVSFRCVPAPGPGNGSSQTSPGGPTGFYDPPTWAQVQTMDAATAGPGGTQFLVGAQGPGGGGGAAADGGSGSGGSTVPIGLTLAVEPANLYGQSSAASLGSNGGHGRTNLRAMAAGHGGGAGLRVAVPSPGPAANAWAQLNGGLPPLAEAISPTVVPPATSAGAALAFNVSGNLRSNAAAAAAATPPPGRQRSRAAFVRASAPASEGGGLSAAAAGADTAASQLPSLSPMSMLPVSGPAGFASRRHSMATVGK